MKEGTITEDVFSLCTYNNREVEIYLLKLCPVVLASFQNISPDFAG